MSNKQSDRSPRKKALIIASVASMLDNFNRSNIDILLSLDYKVVIAANFHTKEDINSQEKIDEFSGEMKAKGVKCVHIDFSRRVSNVAQQLKSIRQVRELLKQRFDLIHCHSPICAAIVRFEAQKYREQYGTKVFYTAHGFHFYDGAPIKNWIIFFSIEKLCSCWTDVLITINKEDYKRAKKKFHAMKTVYIPGVGVDTEKFRDTKEERENKRRELGLNYDDIMLLSVGELSIRKNHRIVLEALGKIQSHKLHYYIAGIGQREEEYRLRINEIGLNDKIHLLGYRTDIPELCQAADIFIFPSLQEGLPMAMMEAMAVGLPVVASNIRGNSDLIDKGKGGYLFDVNDLESLMNAIMETSKEFANNRCIYNQEKIKNYDIRIINRKMKKIYGAKG